MKKLTVTFLSSSPLSLSLPPLSLCQCEWGCVVASVEAVLWVCVCASLSPLVFLPQIQHTHTHTHLPSPYFLWHNNTCLIFFNSITHTSLYPNDLTWKRGRSLPLPLPSPPTDPIFSLISLEECVTLFFNMDCCHCRRRCYKLQAGGIVEFCCPGVFSLSFYLTLITKKWKKISAFNVSSESMNCLLGYFFFVAAFNR